MRLWLLEVSGHRQARKWCCENSDLTAALALTIFLTWQPLLGKEQVSARAC